MLSLIKKKYGNISLGIKATVWYIFGTVIIKGINFLVVPLLSRVLTVDQFGLYSLYNSWAQIISILVTMNLSYGVYVRGMTKFEADKDTYTASMQFLTLPIALVWFLGTLLLNDLITVTTNIHYLFFLLMIVQAFMMSGHSFWSTRNKFEMNYKAFTYVSIIMGLGIPTAKVISLLIPNLDNGIAVIIAQVVFQFFFGLVFIAKNIKKNKIKWRKITSYWSFALKFNLPLVPYYLSQILLDQMDKIMIASMLSQSDVALYNIPYQISMLLTVIATSISNSLVPMIHKRLKDNENMDELRKNITKILFLLFIFSTFLNLLAPEILWLMAPPQYYEAIWIVSPIVAGMFFKFLTTIFNNIEFYYELPSISLVSSVVAIIFNGGLNYYFIPRVGIAAAAYTTLFSFLLSCLIHFVVLKRKKLNHAYSESSIMLISLATLVISFLSRYVYNTPLIRWAIIISLAAILVLFRNKIVNYLDKETIK